MDFIKKKIGFLGRINIEFGQIGGDLVEVFFLKDFAMEGIFQIKEGLVGGGDQITQVTEKGGFTNPAHASNDDGLGSVEFGLKFRQKVATQEHAR